ncbi:hypothetical protein [Aquamicrobium zhengzhouense]|uniref:Uncharacterized protein n=1 Tax=Aquamicrobium zhengzhouense TaxID=2781738 RepID=A0ABS0SAP5_9HYPH|nr:hypothetical protein [Aquamicrobium zhengzhouense]MBI1620360.1 hypothetical protein [Aquamicrobium zhengzhouense]
MSRFKRVGGLSRLSDKGVARGGILDFVGYAQGSTSSLDISHIDIQPGDLILGFASQTQAGSSYPVPGPPPGYTVIATAEMSSAKMAAFYKLSDGTETNFTPAPAMSIGAVLVLRGVSGIGNFTTNATGTGQSPIIKPASISEGSFLVFGFYRASGLRAAGFAWLANTVPMVAFTPTSELANFYMEASGSALWETSGPNIALEILA